MTPYALHQTAPCNPREGYHVWATRSGACRCGGRVWSDPRAFCEGCASEVAFGERLCHRCGCRPGGG